MPTDVVMPQMGESITEGTLTKWLKQPGDKVERDEPLFEISTDKVDAEIPSPAAGVMGEIKIQEGATVEINTVVCTLLEAGEAASAPPAAQQPPDQKAESAEPAAEATEARNESIAPPAPEAAADLPAAASSAGAGTEVAMPQMGESITEGTLTKWLKNIGDTVARDEPIFEISTDKVDAEIPSPIAGTLTEIKVKEGETVQVGTIVAMIGTPGGAAAAPAGKPAASTPAPAAAAASPEKPAASQPSASQGEPPRSSPLVRKMASENNIDLHQVAGTGANGRISKQDMVGHMASGGSKPASSQPASSQPTTPGIAAAAAAPQQSPNQQANAAAQHAAPGTTAIQASVSAVQSAPRNHRARQGRGRRAAVGRAGAQ